MGNISIISIETIQYQAASLTVLEGSHLVAFGQERAPFIIHHGVPTIDLDIRQFKVEGLQQQTSITKQAEDFWLVSRSKIVSVIIPPTLSMPLGLTFRLTLSVEWSS